MSGECQLSVVRVSHMETAVLQSGPSGDNGEINMLQEDGLGSVTSGLEIMEKYNPNMVLHTF